MIVKTKGKQQGSHVHVDIFMGNTEESLGRCGSLVFREPEWIAFEMALRIGAPTNFTFLNNVQMELPF